MFKGLIQKIKEWAYRMNIIKGVKDVNAAIDININEDFYSKMDEWKHIYGGYFSEWHDIRYMTISGPKERIMATLNMPKTVASEMAALVFNEKCEISLSDDGFNEYIEQVFRDNNFDSEFQRYLEYMFALGGFVAKPFVSEGKMKIRFVTPDCFIPLKWDADDITEAVFLNETLKGKDKYTLLEWHRWENGVYTVTNELYKADKSSQDLGIKVSLEELYPGLQESVGMPLVKVPLFVYFKPNTANNIDIRSPLGIPIYANALDIIKSIDIAFDSLQREFRLGRKRILVPDYAVKAVVDVQTGETHRYFDDTDETYEAMKFGENETNAIKDISVELRVEDHVSAINALLGHLAMQTGFSTGTFTFDTAGLKTATEVISENSKTFRTKKGHETNVESGLKHLVQAIGHLSTLYKLYNAPEDVELIANFDDSIITDTQATINQQTSLVSMGLQDKISALQAIYNITEEEAEQKLKKISENQKEAAQIAASQVDTFGM